MMMLLAPIGCHPTGLTRNVFLLIDPQLIGTLKFTVILVSTSTSTAPSIGFVDTTTGRGFIAAFTAVDFPAHTSITIAIIATRLNMDFSVTAAPVALPIAKTRDTTNARSMPRS